jgi:hypothetical protein
MSLSTLALGRPAGFEFGTELLAESALLNESCDLALDTSGLTVIFSGGIATGQLSKGRINMEGVDSTDGTPL